MSQAAPDELMRMAADAVGIPVEALGVILMLAVWVVVYLLCSMAGAGSRAWIISAVPMVPVCLMLRSAGIVSLAVSMTVIITLVVAAAVHARGLLLGDDRYGQCRDRRRDRPPRGILYRS